MINAVDPARKDLAWFCTASQPHLEISPLKDIPNTKTREGNLSRFILFCSIIIFRSESLLAPAGSGDAS